MANGENIDLGSFTWDLSAIDKQILENKKQMQGYSEALKFNKDALKQQSKEIQNAAKTIAALEVVQQELNKALRDGSISEDEYTQSMAALNTEMQETRNNISETIATQSELLQSNIEMERSMRDLQQETRTLNTLRQAGREEAYEEVGAYKALNDELNALKRESKDLGAEMVRMKNNGEENTDAYKALQERYAAVTDQASELNDEFIRLDGAVGDNQRNVGNYTESIKNAFSSMGEGITSILSGDVKGGLDTFKDGLKESTDTAKKLFSTLMANPWLIIVAGLALYVKEMIAHNAEIVEANAKVEQLAGTTGELTDELRRAGNAITETFSDKSFEDAITEMDSLMDDFKISSQEAFDIYAAGLAKGGAANGEFGDSIKEYGSLFAQNGYEAERFIAILNTGIDLGIYSDKLPDAIKEAGLALNEQTKATRDALINAFGAPFTDALLIRVQKGQTTVAEALDEISEKAEKANLNQQQLAQLTADLFKGAGEDAGGALVVFDAVNKSQEDMRDNLTELQQATVDLAVLNLELEKAKDAAFASKSVQTFQKDMEVVWKRTQVIFYNLLGSATKLFKTNMDLAEMGFRAFMIFLQTLPGATAAIFMGMAKDINNLSSIAVTAGKVIWSALKGDLSGAQDNFKSLTAQISNFSIQSIKAAENYKNSMLKVYNDIAADIAKRNAGRAAAQAAEDKAAADAEKARQAAITGAAADAEKARLAAIQKAKDAEAKKAESKRVSDLKKAAADQEKYLEEETKRAVEAQKQRAQQSIDIAKNELAEYIRINAEKYKDDKSLADAKLKEQLAYFDTVEKKQKALNEAEREAAAIAIDAKIRELEAKRNLNANDLEEVKNLNASLNILNEEARQKDLETEKNVAEKKKEVNTKYQDDVREQDRLHRAIMFQQKILELEIEGGRTKDILLAQEDERFQEQLDKFAEQNQIKFDLDNDKYIADQEVQIARDALQDEYDLAKDDKERQRIQNQMDALDLMAAQNAENTTKITEEAEKAKLSAISDTFGQAKGLFKENTLAYKAMAIAEATIATYLGVVKTMAEYPGPIGWAMSAVQIALGLANVAKIVGVKGFSKGGYTGDGGINDPAGIVHKGEVVFSQADVKALGGASVVNAMRPTYGGYLSGGSVGVSTIPSVQSSLSGSNMNVVIDDNSVALIAGAIYEGSQAGLEAMADNIAIRNNANFS